MTRTQVLRLKDWGQVPEQVQEQGRILDPDQVQDKSRESQP